MNLLNELNPKQKEAVTHKNGPLLIVAGAGTGKTRALTYRMAYLISEGVDPENILGITFTNKAATEMRERIHSLLLKTQNEEPKKVPLIKTFHSLGVYLLKKHPKKARLPQSFSIIDSQDQLALIKESMKRVGINPKEEDPRKFRSIISRAKNSNQDPNDFASRANNAFLQNTAAVWLGYEDLKQKEHGLDFDDLLRKSYELLSNNPDVLDFYQDYWQYIHIDEYQDTNSIQYQSAEILSAKHGNLCVVGDSDQNIYSWRGASLRNILSFEKDFPGAKVVLLEENYRSTKTILDAADAVIQKNKDRIDKTLRTDKEKGDTITLYGGWSESGESTFIAKECKRLIKEENVNPNEIAVLFRTNFQSRNLEEAFLKQNLPYQVVGTRFFDRKEIRDLVAYLEVAHNPESLSFLKRTVNTPKRGIGKVALTKILSGKASELTGKAKAGYEDYLRILEAIRAYSKNHPPSYIIKFIMNHTGYLKMLEEGSPEEKERVENLKELVTYATKYDELPIEEALEKMREDIALMSDQDTNTKDNGESIKLMTIHASKGLEYKYIFITGLEQGLFPSSRSDEADDPEEERRLMYVAITRAKEKLYLTYARQRRIFGQNSIQILSEFVYDIPDELFDEKIEEDYTATGLLDDDLPIIY